MTSPLNAIVAATAYPRTSRYYGVETAVLEAADGREIPYLRRRLLSPLAEATTLTLHTVAAGDRLDLLAFRYLGDAEQWWRIAEANPALDPDELTATPGATIRIPVPQAASGVYRG